MNLQLKAMTKDSELCFLQRVNSLHALSIELMQPNCNIEHITLRLQESVFENSRLTSKIHASMLDARSG